VKPESVRNALAAAWGATEPLTDPPLALARQLVADRYGKKEWNLVRR
jgi:hypothetical protein